MTRAAILVAGLGLLALAGCQKPLPLSRVDQADASACRARADEIYLKQNRGLMSVRDSRDTPFAATGMSGNTTQGLGDLYGRDQMVASCLNSVGPASANGGAGPSQAPSRVAPSRVGPSQVGPTMSPGSASPDSALTPG